MQLDCMCLLYQIFRNPAFGLIFHSVSPVHRIAVSVLITASGCRCAYWTDQIKPTDLGKTFKAFDRRKSTFGASTFVAATTCVRLDSRLSLSLSTCNRGRSLVFIHFSNVLRKFPVGGEGHVVLVNNEIPHSGVCLRVGLFANVCFLSLSLFFSSSA